MNIIRRLADNRIDTSWATQMRRRRFALFRSIIDAIPRPIRILDVGGTPGFWETMNFSDDACTVVVMNVAEMPVRQSFVTSIAGDARNMEFPDRSFDIVFSNSVLEHVGTYDDQRRMAAEVQRVGQRYFVQTPNRWFPLEPHFLVPYWQFLPLALRTQLIRRFNLGWYKRRPDPDEARALVSHIRLLDAAEMKQIFPHATLYRERLFGLTKSFVAYQR